MEKLTVPFEIKEMNEQDDKFFVFEGLASTFGNVDLVDDVVDKGAFENSLVTRMPKVLWQHDTAEPIGMPEQIRETEQGLFLKGKLPKDDTFVTGRVIPQLKIGSISSMSIGFTVKDFEVEDGIRHLKEVDLFEISLVTFPANTKAEVTGFKSIRKEDLMKIKTIKEYRKLLKDSGCFTKHAREFLAAQFNPCLCDTEGACLCDAEGKLTEDMVAFTKKLNERFNR
jgi:HK97 family phage prohead protease